MKPIVILVLLLCLRSTLVFGQVKIGNNPQNIDLSSVLELESNTKVLVITRITNLEMEAIIPQRGGVVYNTDTQCLHYFNGTEWINLCDAVSFSLTNEAIENITSTINIVDNGDTINLEVAPNSIRSENIIDGGINGNDIQNNSIGNDQLGGDSVGASELRDNSVGTSELIDRSIEASDMANSFPNQVLTTDVNGIVNWSEASDLQVAVTDRMSIIGIGTLENPLSIAPIFQTTVSDNTAAIVAHIGTDLDTDNQNEILTNAILDGNELVLTESGTERRVNLTKYINTDNQTINRFDFNPVTNQLTLEIQNGGTREITLNNLNNTGTDEQTLSISNDILEISGGNALPLTAYINTDDQILKIDGNKLTITGLNGGNSIGLPASTVNTDNQQISINADGTQITLQRGGTISLPTVASEVDGIIGNEITNTADSSLVRSGNGIAGDPYLIGVNVGGIDTPELADAAVTNLKIGANAVTTNNILDANVTEQKINPSATNGQVLTTIAGATVWEDLTSSATTGSILFSNGTGGVTEDNAQLYWDGINMSIGNVARPLGNKFSVNGQIRASSFAPNPNGSATNPPYRFTNDVNSGMFLANTSELAFTTNSTEAMRIIANGNVGIGPIFATGTTIAERLHVDGNIRAEGAITATGDISTTSDVIGANFPDYVFQKYFTGASIIKDSYQFQSLKEIEDFVKQNQHLPGVKSAVAIKEQGFWNLGEASRINLEKIEELFLHTIEQEKKIKSLENTNSALAHEVELLIAQMEEIKKMLTAKNNH